MAVRFGNVLGSNGSVTRIFEQQIAAGGPVTVTHPEIRRYFMLDRPKPSSSCCTPRPCAAPARSTPWRWASRSAIQDLARNLIRLSGFVPDEDIEVKFVGLRPGEKL